MIEFFNTDLITLGSLDITVGMSILLTLFILFIIVFFKNINKAGVTNFFKITGIEHEEHIRIRRIIWYLTLLISALVVVLILGIDFSIYRNENYGLNLSHIIAGLIVFMIARLLDWLISNVFIHKYYRKRDDEKNPSFLDEKEDEEGIATSSVKYIFYTLAGIILLQVFNLDLSLFNNTINGRNFEFKISNILSAVLVLLIARLIIWIFTKIILYNFYKTRNIEVGAQFAINQLIKYVIYLFAIIIALENLGINMTLIMGGAAALLVGIGLGLQQTFNDFISGLVLLFERSVSVGDILEVDGKVGTVKEIGMRSSILETRGNISLVVPNSKLVNEQVVNWTHYTSKVRFEIPIGVAYGTDTKLVKKTLLNIAKNNPYIIDYPAPFVRFNEFGDSALLFSLFFFSRNYIIIEDIKSDMRFEIDEAFRKEGINIPFPQREVWINPKE